MIGRIVDQVNFQTRPVGKLNHSLEKLGASARVLGTIVKINHQTSYLAELGSSGNLVAEMEIPVF